MTGVARQGSTDGSDHGAGSVQLQSSFGDATPELLDGNVFGRTEGGTASTCIDRPFSYSNPRGWLGRIAISMTTEFSNEVRDRTMIGPSRATLPRSAAFVVASASLMLIFLSSGTPIPLYNTFRVEDGLTDADLALTTVTYLCVTALSLLMFGRLSNHLGRRPMAIMAMASSIAGTAILTQVHTLPMLVGGRALQGLACGIASSAIGAMVIDLAPTRRYPWLPAVITSSAPAFAIPLGALISGALIEFGPAPRQLGFTSVAVVLSFFTLLMFACPESGRRRPGALRSLLPRVHVPTGAGRAVLAAGGTLVATWSFSSFYQAFAPGLTADYLGTTDALMIAVVFASVVILSPLGGICTGRWRPSSAQRMGLAVFVAGAIGAVVSLHHAAIVPFLIASATAGFAQGAANSGGMRGVLAGLPAEDRAGTLSTLYLISYTGGAVPGLVAGRLTNTIALPDIGTGYVVVVIVASIVAVLAGLTSYRPPSRTDDFRPDRVAHVS